MGPSAPGRHSLAGQARRYRQASRLLADVSPDTSETHVRAAWQQAAEDYERDCLRRYGRLLPPHEVLPAPALARPSWEPLCGPWSRYQRLRGCPLPNPASTARTTAVVRIPAPRASEPDCDEVLAEIRRLVDEATAVPGR